MSFGGKLVGEEAKKNICEYLRPLCGVYFRYLCPEKKDELKGYSSISKAGPHVYIFWCVND